MKKFLLSIFFIFLFLSQVVFADENSIKITSVAFDTSSSVLMINSPSEFTSNNTSKLKLIKMSNPNRVYFDINSAILATKKEDINFTQGVVKHAVVAQNSVNPDVVRVVLTLDEKYSADKIDVYRLKNSIIVKYGDKPLLKEEYFQNTFRENRQDSNDYYEYSAMTTQVITKKEVPVSSAQNVTIPTSSMKDIQSAFALANIPKEVESAFSDVKVEQIKRDLKLNTRYYLNSINKTSNGILLSGFGSVAVEKALYLSEPARIVYDLPNTLASKEVRSKEYSINETETIKVGQFETNKTRLVLKTNKPDKYIPIYSPDNETLLLADKERYNVASLSNIKASLTSTYYEKNGQNNDVILAFNAPVVYSVYRKADDFILTIYNIDKYNEAQFTNAIKNTNVQNLKLKIEGQLLTVSYKLQSNGTTKVYSGLDGKSLKISISEPQLEQSPIKKIVPPVFTNTKKKAGEKVIVIDAGHGGTDCGATRAGIKESDINLAVAQRLEAILKQKGYKVYMTRSDNSTVSLQERVDIAEGKDEDIFVSIHVNSSENTSPVGLETHYYHDYSYNLAKCVQAEFVKNVTESPNRGLIKSRFYVINHTTKPAILVEIGFISNEKERMQLVSADRQQRTAKGIAEGIVNYFKQYDK